MAYDRVRPGIPVQARDPVIDNERAGARAREAPPGIFPRCILPSPTQPQLAVPFAQVAACGLVGVACQQRVELLGQEIDLGQHHVSRAFRHQVAGECVAIFVDEGLQCRQGGGRSLQMPAVVLMQHADVHRPEHRQLLREMEFEAVLAVADAGRFQVATIPIGKQPAGDRAIERDHQPDRARWIALVESPPGDLVTRNKIELSPEHGALRDRERRLAPAHRLMKRPGRTRRAG